MSSWAPARAGDLPAVVVAFMPAETAVLAWALVVLFVPFLVGGLLPLPRPDPGAERGWARRSAPRTLFVALLAAGLGTNALGHVGQALLLGGYVPGLATGLTVALPYAGWTVRELGRHGLLSARGAAGSVAASALLQPPLLVGLVAILRMFRG